jgi:hypothetical protein
MAFGVMCLVTWGALHIDGLTGARHELERFAVSNVGAAHDRAAGPESCGDPKA